MTIRVFLSGQSNALGRGTGGLNWSDIDSRVRVWDNANPLGANGTAWRTAAVARSTYGTFDFTNRNNFGVWFCHRLAQVRDDDVDMVIVGRGGTAIEAWGTSSPSVPMLAECDDVYSATGQDPAHVFLWHQGESDTSTDPAAYKADFLALVADLMTAGVIDATTVIIVGGLLENTQSQIDFNTDVLQDMADENPQIFYANSSGLSSYDGIHFTGDSLYTLGVERYFAAYAEAEGFVMNDLFALVNEGGTPGVPGTGENKLYNLLNLALIGMGAKNVTSPPEFNGIMPANELMTAGMIAAGAVVENGISEDGDLYIRWESGIQLCACRRELEYSSPSVMLANWTYPRPFSSQPYVISTGSGAPGSGIVGNLPSTKRGGSLSDYVNPTNTEVTLRLLSDADFVSGETWGSSAYAIGFWK